MWSIGHTSQSKAVCQELIEETWSSYKRKLGKRRACTAGKVESSHILLFDFLNNIILLVT